MVASARRHGWAFDLQVCKLLGNQTNQILVRYTWQFWQLGYTWKAWQKVWCLFGSSLALWTIVNIVILYINAREWIYLKSTIYCLCYQLVPMEKIWSSFVFVTTFRVLQTNCIRRFKQTTNWAETLTRVFDYKYFELVLCLHLYFSNFPNWSQTGSKQTTRILGTYGTPMSISPIYICWMPVNCSKLFVLVGKCVSLVCLA